MVKMDKSTFQSHLFTATIGELNAVFRVLKMVNSIFIYIGIEGNESLDEIGVALPLKNNEIVGTTAMGPLLGCDSKELAVKLSKRLNKQVYVSCNITADRITRPLIEKHLSEKIKNNPEYF